MEKSNVIDFNTEVAEEKTTMTDTEMKTLENNARIEMVKQQAAQTFSQHIGGLTESAHSSALASVLIDKGIITGEELSNKVKTIVSDSLVKFKKEIEEAKTNLIKDDILGNVEDRQGIEMVYDELLVLVNDFTEKMFADLEK